jgi:hypothetical protein
MTNIVLTQGDVCWYVPHKGHSLMAHRIFKVTLHKVFKQKARVRYETGITELVGHTQLLPAAMTPLPEVELVSVTRDSITLRPLSQGVAV